MRDTIFTQCPHKLKLDWGWRGCAAAAAARGEIVVIVDVLRFSTMCAAAASRHVAIIPAAMDEDLQKLARANDAQLPPTGFARLSPDSYSTVASRTRLVVKSPNGATCARVSKGSPHVLFGAIVNASAVAKRVNQLMSNSNLATTVIACGERWHDEGPDGKLRFAIEDYLGAGAILSKLKSHKSAEAIVCENAFRASQQCLPELLLDCASGRELVARGLKRDVEVAASLDLFNVAPTLRGNVIDCSNR